MNELKEIAELFGRFISQPSKEWKALSESQETDNEQFYRRYLYPIFGMITLVAFVGLFLTNAHFDLQLALKRSILSITSVFIGFYLAAFLLSEGLIRVFHQPRELNLCQRFTGYASLPIYSSFILLSLFPEFFFIYLFTLYSIYIVWEGAIPYMQMNESEQLKFTVLASTIILLSPYLINLLMFMLMPGLRA
ncbi:MAG: YIP1 family protein [Dysgonamonadaceae bacterium]|nr:YIP1 family protein [Dysgonamonadaceae bacterium]